MLNFIVHRYNIAACWLCCCCCALFRFSIWRLVSIIFNFELFRICKGNTFCLFHSLPYLSATGKYSNRIWVSILFCSVTNYWFNWCQFVKLLTFAILIKHQALTTIRYQTMTSKQPDDKIVAMGIFLNSLLDSHASVTEDLFCWIIKAIDIVCLNILSNSIHFKTIL